MAGSAGPRAATSDTRPTLADATYGSDESTGLVWAYELTPGAAPKAIECADAASRLANRSGASWLWLHFSLTNATSIRWLREKLVLPGAFYESIQENPSTRVEAVDEALIATIRDVPFFGPEGGQDASVAIYVDSRLMVSARTRQLRSVERLRAAVKAGASLDTPAELLAHLLRDQADVLMENVREAAKRVDDIEDRLLDSSYSKGRSTLGQVRRRLVRLQRQLAPEPAALFRLLNRPPHWLRESDTLDLRRSAEELAAAVADSNAVVERIRILQDELSAQLDEATNRTLYILTVLTAIFAPFEFISQLFGMGVGGVPFHDNPHGFAIVVVIILGVIGLGAALVRGLLRRS